MKASPSFYAFGPYILDKTRGMLLESGAPVPLTPRAFELLLTLVEGAGERLDKDQLIRRVWGATVVEENNLTRQVSTLRKALGERPGQHEYIATVPGMGYRFVAPVTELETLPVPPPVAVAAAAIAPVEPPRRRGPAVVASAVLLVLVAGLFVATRYLGHPPSPAAPRALSQFTFGSGLQQDPAWSPNGHRLAFASDRLGTLQVWIQDLGDPEPVRLTASTAREWQPSWSPDGQRIAFRSDRDGGGLFVVSLTGGGLRKISDFGDRPTWSPAGDLILFSNASSRTGARKLFVVDPVRGAPRDVCAEALAPFISGSWLSSVEAAWYPDGRRISILGRLRGQWSLVTVPLDGGVPVTSEIPETIRHDINASGLSLARFVWAPSGRFLYFEGQTGNTRNVWRVSVSPATLAWQGSIERLTVDVSAETDIALTRDGRRLAFTVRSERTAVWAMDFDPRIGKLTGGARALTSSSAGQVDVDALKDGSRLVYRDVRAGRNELREYSLDSRRDRVLLVSSDWSPSSPRWSADGHRLAFARPAVSKNASGASVIAILTPDQGQERLVSLPGDARLRPSDWSLDGTTILGDCRIDRDGPRDICTVTVADGSTQVPRLRTLVHDPTKHLFGPRFSPDQRWISFVAVDAKGSTHSQVFLAPVGGGSWVPITDGRSFDDKVRWDSDGRAIYFVSDRSGYLNLYGRKFDPVRSVPVGGVFPVTAFDTPRRGLPSNIPSIEFGIAQRRLFLPLTETTGEIWVLERVDR